MNEFLWSKITDVYCLLRLDAHVRCPGTGTSVNAAFSWFPNDNLDTGAIAQALLEALNLSTIALVCEHDFANVRIFTDVYPQISQLFLQVSITK